MGRINTLVRHILIDVIHNLPLHANVVDAPSYIFAKHDYVEKREKFKNVHNGILTVSRFFLVVELTCF